MTIEQLDPRALRDAFGAFPTGVTVVTTRDQAGVPIGFTANSFTSVSLDPPLLLVCLAKTSRNFTAMTSATSFAINVLSETQKHISNTFARPVEDRFATVEWASGSAGCPILADVAAWFECTLEQVIEAGDHVILMGRIASFENSGRNGLGYARGGYFTPILASKAVSAAAEGHIELGAVLERHGEVLLLGDDVLSLPGCDGKDGSPADLLRDYLEELTGLSVTIGFLYSVYEGKSDGKQHIVYRAFASDGEPRNGRFLKPDTLTKVRFKTSSTADIVARFAVESQIGNFGVYFGDETVGTVRPVPAKAARP
ncbi:flavin reductase family protein [Agrobacterium sp. SHOUNA12C]|uniref:Flavoprotein oxidoreductase protein n=2 Tax=Rhizobium rhizogenes TaxID=359 RepID=B9JLH4_RHIR8|nr:flavin reductase family protein [Rhizobium rhizogenes]ACM30710.1 flavoprotein oxidoreductase protein [Rhizobium rhizogenes K84]KAA6488887.1 flavin reductase [Agrobacterium sp. ICMP 7243]MCJ9721044.1 flavin reductase family protein [Agrobacterium sp. BETTINA12B]MCJ9755801.1 flavin reductase family protein [Agrobacterium sp. SHOUNA12C]OCJ01508.1 flavin reductase [Agrobacterium sp. 13-626]OCJ16047.1 flavin reductase [Agrobacterium sp. B131/95]